MVYLVISGLPMVLALSLCPHSTKKASKNILSSSGMKDLMSIRITEVWVEMGIKYIELLS